MSVDRQWDMTKIYTTLHTTCEGKNADIAQQFFAPGGSAAQGAKHAVIVLDSARASEKDLRDFAQALQAGKVRIRPNGVRKIQGSSEGAKWYGAGPDDEATVISTEAAVSKKP